MGPFSAQGLLLKDAVQQHVGATTSKIVGLLVAGVFLLLALGFAAGAVFFQLSRIMTPTAAALWVAGGLLVLALVVWLVSRLIANHKRRKAQEAVRAATMPLAGLAGVALLKKAARGIGASSRSTAPSHQPPPGAPPSPAVSGPPTSHDSALHHGMEVGHRMHDALAQRPLTITAAGLGVGLALGYFPAVRRTLRGMMPF